MQRAAYGIIPSSTIPQDLNWESHRVLAVVNGEHGGHSPSGET